MTNLLCTNACFKTVTHKQLFSEVVEMNPVTLARFNSRENTNGIAEGVSLSVYHHHNTVFSGKQFTFGKKMHCFAWKQCYLDTQNSNERKTAFLFTGK